ncbi:MAG: hypothetical protein BGO67_08765 [Alphaproteobacteria bacterium 41-28]|nr:MAG: hypothetical protein BGO67_08765 [Alphaproteobacteria bacterium 41-28]
MIVWILSQEMLNVSLGKQTPAYMIRNNFSYKYKQGLPFLGRGSKIALLRPLFEKLAHCIQ